MREVGPRETPCVTSCGPGAPLGLSSCTQGWGHELPCSVGLPLQHVIPMRCGEHGDPSPTALALYFGSP